MENKTINTILVILLALSFCYNLYQYDKMNEIVDLSDEIWYSSCNIINYLTKYHNDVNDYYYLEDFKREPLDFLTC